MNKKILQFVKLCPLELPDFNTISKVTLGQLEQSNILSVSYARKMWQKTEEWLLLEPVANRHLGPLIKRELLHDLSPFFLDRGGNSRVLQKTRQEYDQCLQFVNLPPCDVFGSNGDMNTFISTLRFMAAAAGVCPNWRHVAVQTKPDAKGGTVIYPDAREVLEQLYALYDFVRVHFLENPHFCAVVLLVAISHIHPLVDGNGRLSRLIYNWISFSECRNQYYLPIYESCALSDGGQIIRKRIARRPDGWGPIIEHFVMLNERFRSKSWICTQFK